MSPVGVRHARAARNLIRLLPDILPKAFALDVQNPIHLPDNSEPLPDLAVLHYRKYRVTPTVADVPLVIEVSDSTLAYDQGEKRALCRCEHPGILDRESACGRRGAVYRTARGHIHANGNRTTERRTDIHHRARPVHPRRGHPALMHDNRYRFRRSILLIVLSSARSFIRPPFISRGPGVRQL